MLELYEVPIPATLSTILAYIVVVVVLLLGAALLWDIVIGGTRDAADREKEREDETRKLTPREAAKAQRILDAMDELADEMRPLGRRDPSDEAEAAVSQSERLLRAQRYGPDSEAGQIAVNALTLVTIIAATALVATIGAHALAAWLASIVAALTT